MIFPNIKLCGKYFSVFFQLVHADKWSDRETERRGKMENSVGTYL
jgi:hypothetical protein